MLKNRIQSDSGATILIALLFFLMCATVGSIVLAAGSASAGRISGLVQDEQSYYTVTSAAQLFKEEIENQQISFDAEDAVNGDRTYKSELNSQIKSLLQEGFDTIYAGSNDTTSNDTTYTKEITVTPPSQLDKVTGQFIMDENYNIMVILSVDGAEDSYVCTVNAQPVSPTVKEKQEYTETVTENGQQVQKTYYKYYTSVSWNKVTIEKGA